jgi:hypothetical protein
LGLYTSFIPIPIPRLLGEATLSLRAATSIAEVAPRSSEQLLRGAWLTLVLGTEATPWAVRFATRSLEEREETGSGAQNEKWMGKGWKIWKIWRF